jgi:hypothetical protein
MALLSAKNKRMAILLGALAFAVILVAAIVRATKAGAKSANEIGQRVWADLKSFMSFGNVVLLLVSAAVLLFAPTGTGPFVLAIALGTLTTGAAVVTSFNTTYVPKFFSYTAATQLTGIKITVQGEGIIFDSDANGLNHCGVNRVVGQVTNTFLFRIANGFIKGKNVIWEFTNSAAQTPVVYISSDQTPDYQQVGTVGGPMYLQLLRQAVLASSGQDFRDFATLSLPSIAATDVVNVLYRDGTQQQLNRADLQYQLSLQQNVVNTPVYMIDNYGQTVKEVNFIGAAAQTAYLQRWVPMISGGMIRQSIN